jgi:hypothetical protein
MPDKVGTGLIRAIEVARANPTRRAPNGIAYSIYGDPALPVHELERLVQAVPPSVAAALVLKEFYFVPLAMSPGRRAGDSETMIATAYTPELADDAICHRNVSLGTLDGIFLSTRLLGDKFAIAFELFINIGHAFVDSVGVPETFADLAWAQVLADTRGETSQDAWESRAESRADPTRIDEKAKGRYIEAAFSDALAIYLLSLALDFDYSELREREYPLLAPKALAERLQHMARLFPPNPGYEFAIKYRRRA